MRSTPDIKVIAPWREWDLTSRTALIDWAEQHQIPVPKDKRGESPFSTDANLLHTSSRGQGARGSVGGSARLRLFSAPTNPEDAPDTPEYITIDFERGDGVALNGEAMSPATLLAALNELGRKHGIGRLDLVENRFVGMKSRGMYETPGGEIYARAHRGIEQITLDRGAAHLKDELMPKYAELIYNGFWFAPEREMLQAAIDHSQAKVIGHRAAQALQGHGPGGRPQVARQPLFGAPRDLRGRRRRLRPAGRRGLHQAQRAAAAALGAAGSLKMGH